MNCRKTLSLAVLLVLSLSSASANGPVKSAPKLQEARLAAGCFWGVEEYFRKVPGVATTEVGYAGGKTPKPDYETVSQGNSGFAESVQIKFDSTKITYDQLLTLFFKMHDPTTLNAQGNDQGTQYRSAIFPNDVEQKSIAEKIIAKIEKSKAWKKPITTSVEMNASYYPAESYHQKYLVKHPGGYDNHFVRNLNFD